MARKSTNSSQCDVSSGKVDLAYYEKLDSTWQKLGIAAPARRGLIDHHLFELADLTKLSKAEFLAIHGIGPTAAKLISNAMTANKLSFKTT